MSFTTDLIGKTQGKVENPWGSSAKSVRTTKNTTNGFPSVCQTPNTTNNLKNIDALKCPGNFRLLSACSQGIDKDNNPKMVKMHFSVERDFWAEDKIRRKFSILMFLIQIVVCDSHACNILVDVVYRLQRFMGGGNMRTGQLWTDRRNFCIISSLKKNTDRV